MRRSPGASSRAGIDGGPGFWSAVRGNLGILADAGDWWRIVSGATQPLIEDREVTDKAAALLPEEPWDDTTWDTWIGALKNASGRKGRALFHPLRMALTGREDGPELKLLLPLIGRDRAEARLFRGRTSLASMHHVEPGGADLAHEGDRHLAALTASPTGHAWSRDSRGPRRTPPC